MIAALRFATLGMAGLVLALAACAPPPTPPPAPVAAGPAIQVVATPVPLNPDNPAQQAIGAFAYAGGIAITSPDSSRLHGLSDLKIAADGRVLAVTDEGDAFEARLVLDAAGRLTGLTDAKLEPLRDLGGHAIQGKDDGDAEGLALMPNNDRLVSFERNHRIWLYPADGSAPQVAPKPDNLFSDNEGMEALAAYPFLGADAYLVGGEEGELWSCRLAAGCTAAPTQALAEFGFVAVAPFGGDVVATLHRAYDPVRNNRIVVKIVASPLAHPRTLAAFTMEAPLTRDNFEGLALAALPDGKVRLYLLSDDNFNDRQRTLLMAFDWSPGK